LAGKIAAGALARSAGQEVFALISMCRRRLK
jgi:hypothetical protein